MDKEPNNEGVRKNQGPKEKTKLIFNTYDNRELTGVELPWRGSIGIVGRQTRFYDSVEALAELPKREELPKILQASRRVGIPSIWNRARPSALESSAAALLTALAFSGRKQWVPLIRQFFKTHGLKVGLRGRPRLHPRQLKHMVRGIEIDHMVARLQKGFETRTRLRRLGGFNSGDEEIAAKLKTQGYSQSETDVIVRGATLQDAACRLYHATTGKRENVKLDAIRNSYAKYKSLRPPN
jgi:hypothetical protein